MQGYSELSLDTQAVGRGVANYGETVFLVHQCILSTYKALPVAGI